MKKPINHEGTQRFHFEADPNSPIWGSAQDVKDWLEQWHADGCPVKVKTALPQQNQKQAEYANYFKGVADVQHARNR